MQTNRCRNGQRGNAIVEATLTLTLFLTVLFSIYDFGWVLFFHHTLVHQARTAARFAAINPTSLDSAKNIVLYNQTAAGSGPGILGIDPGNVSVTRSGTAGGTDDRIIVTISGYQYQIVTIGWAGTYNGKPITVSMPVEN